MSRDFAREAALLAATAECMKVLAPLNKDERDRVLFSLVVSSLDGGNPRDNKVIADLLAKMKARIL